MNETFEYIGGADFSDVPPDADYIGPGPLYIWSPDMRAWTTWPMSAHGYWRTEMSKTTEETAPAAPAEQTARPHTGWEVARALQVERNELQARLGALLRHAGTSGQCKGCKRRIYWVHGAETRTAVPFEPDGRNHLQSCVDASEFSRGAQSFELT